MMLALNPQLLTGSRVAPGIAGVLASSAGFPEPDVDFRAEVPFPVFGVTDARFFRRKGVTAYGYAIYTVPFDQFVSRFHGNDERVDQESLRLSAELWERTLRAFLG